jgi:uncharacterized membrane protein YhaH (DUF805 family)
MAPTVIAYAVLGLVSTILGGLRALALYIALIWLGLAISVKRLHDREKSSWFLPVYWGPPMVLGALGFVAHLNDSGGLSLVCALGETAIGIWMFIELGCLRGTPGTNRFGSDPLGSPVPAGTGPVLRG